jgi:hypothetical protein
LFHHINNECNIKINKAIAARFCLSAKIEIFHIAMTSEKLLSGLG